VLILGRKYKFTPLELEELNKKSDNINIVKYRNRDENEVLEELKEYTKQNDFDLLVLNTKAKVENNIIKYLTKLQFEKRNKKVRIITIEHFLEEFLFKCYIPDEYNDLSFLENIKPYSKWQYIQKRAIDFFGIFWLFFFSWPVMLYSAYRIKKESPDGPIFFKQKRVGLNSKEFVCVKFRSMHTNTDYFNHYTQENDPRIFPWGKIMRKYRFDELPQMINILKGEMHLIGPRAEWIELVEKYEKSIPYYNERHLVAPGITGWAQVNYPYGQNLEDTKQKLMYDLYYIKHWSIILEMKVVWKTIKVVLNKKGL
jgi:lipopolysaccharide/colanic/teichoic acid biosynthesis glycosyltransferase